IFSAKIGVHVAHHDIAAVNSRSSIQLPASSKIYVVLEPYFHEEVSLKDRSSFLTIYASLANIVAFKLDVKDPESFASAYTDSVSGKPWFARSDGLSFDDFVARFKEACDRGCTGAIAGSAIWGDLI